MAYCQMCGIEIPDGQSVCSMCYGDPYYGSDGYYLEQMMIALEKEFEEEQLMYELSQQKEKERKAS